MNLRKRVRLLVLAASVMLSLLGASWPLNPLVTRVAEPTGPVPAGCDESLARPATPRVNVAEIPEREIILPASMPAPPPIRSLREELDAAHRALVRNDRPAFDEHLRAARALVASYPAGGERSRAEEVLWALNDAAVLWDAQFQSPFFDETSDAHTRASRYAGYADAMRRSVFTDDSERRFYPAAESRDFVTRIAGERLERLGVRSTASVPPRVVRAETPSPRPVVSSSTSPRSTTTRSASARRRGSTTPKSRKPAALAKSTSSSSPDPSKSATPAPAEPAPSAPPASAPAPSENTAQSTDASAPPVAEDVPSTPIVADPATAAPVEPPATITSTSAPTTTTAAPAAAPAERRSVIVPALLILIGLGVLIVLFRASK